MEAQQPGTKISCYTFGQPRVGNRAFVREYRQRVADHWSLINGNDPVPGVPAGWCVCINMFLLM